MGRRPALAARSWRARSRMDAVRSATVLLGVLWCMALPARGESPVNFSGTWELDKNRSVFPRSVPAVAPGELTMIVDQHGDLLRTERRFHGLGIRRTVISIYYLDGREARNTTPRGETFVSRSHWQGASLVTESKGMRNGKTVEVTIVNRLEENGQILVMESTLRRASQDTPEASRLVFVRK